MADIDIVPHKRTHTWLWIVLAIVAVLIVWAIMANRGTQNRVGRAVTPYVLTPPSTALPSVS